MTKVMLNILASDIKEGLYLNPEHCPITKALARAEYPQLRNHGMGIKNVDLGVYVINVSDFSYMNLVFRVVDMSVCRTRA